MNPCNAIQIGDPIPPGFGAPYTFDGPAAMIVSVACSDTAIELTAGQLGHLVYRTAYAWTGESWTPIALSGSGAGDWLEGPVSAILPDAASVLPRGAPWDDGTRWDDDTGWIEREFGAVLAYVCVASFGRWKCGCRDRLCAQSLWQIQQFRLLRPQERS